MKPRLQSLLAAVTCAALATSCGSSSSKERTVELSEKERTVELSDGVAVDIVKTPQGLWFGKTEVTQAQWEALMGANPSEFKGANNPVENVSWDDCQEFLRRLNALPSVKASGLTFRLPTAEEWEYACRAGATGKFCKLADGTEITEDTLGQIAWFEDNADGKTQPVGQKEPNAFGLYDMHGNVCEWTSTADGEGCVFLGGSWGESAGYCESSLRFEYLPDDRGDDLGFRLCASGGAATKAPAKKTSAKKTAVVEEIIASMIPIPGKDYRMGKFPVTQAQWEAVMGENPSVFKGADNPVEMVSWDDCREFLLKLNALPSVKASGLTFRLPTAEEWEYACRAGATGKFCKLADGTEITEDTLGQIAWFEDNADGKTQPVGQKEPNAFGLYDMHGNVWEWSSTAVGEFRVHLGGCGRNSAGTCGSSLWFGRPPDARYSFLGFRLCASGRAD